MPSRLQYLLGIFILHCHLAGKNIITIIISINSQIIHHLAGKQFKRRRYIKPSAAQRLGRPGVAAV